jgi:hypothetical protein
MLTNVITENTILLKFKKVTICSLFISQRAVKARIIANALHLFWLSLKKGFSWILVFKNASEICLFPEKG